MDTFLAQNWFVLSPVLMLSLTALIVLLTDLWLEEEERVWLAYLSLAGLVGALIITSYRWWTFVNSVGEAPTGFNEMVVLDQLALRLDFVFILVAIVATALAPRYLERRGLNRGEFYALVLFSTAGMMLLAAAQDLIILFLGIEVLSIPLYILAGFGRPRLDSEESALKYFLLGAFATGFLLYGIALVFGATGTTNLNAIRGSAAVRAPTEHPMFAAGLALLFVGFGFKISMAPFHQWTPDVYEGAPTPVTAFMIAGTKAGGIAGLIRLLYWGVSPAAEFWVPLLAVLAAITMTWGNVAALLQQNIKRMLAYSSIAHAGYLLIGVVSGVPISIIVYLIVYGLMNLGAFGVILALDDGEVEVVDISEYKGLSRHHPLLAALMSLFLLSLAGFPPTAGFFGKFLLFSAGIQANLTWLIVIAVLNSVISVFYYVRVIVNMYMHEPAEEPVYVFRRSWLVAGAVAVAVVGIVVLGVYPSAVINLLYPPAV